LGKTGSLEPISIVRLSAHGDVVLKANPQFEDGFKSYLYSSADRPLEY